MEPNLGYSRVFCLLFLASTSLIFLSHWASAATPKLNNQEMKALKEIGSKIGKKDWDFGVDPCSGKGSWNVSDDRKGFQSTVMCDCSFNNNTSCHVVSM
ncbi:probable LRR receptor-like serine/threonine-protein kinase At1g07650 [Vigna umbellata]|uniref:probable LRR receptor-like serine/threonine-protein kinase At1g07650 n=1 Tax=Vigna umbellata TaxID=87088 RepID=UPI001F5ED72C|nr:probable LRR receptor-like serine/threonine-protein kinase At1g07650 [Vigna umbellata]